MLSLPVTDAMTADDARTIAAALARVCDAHTSAVPVTAHPKAPAIASLLVIGGGPAGTALLNAATKRGLLPDRSEEHTTELQSLMRISYAVFCLKKKKRNDCLHNTNYHKHDIY